MPERLLEQYEQRIKNLNDEVVFLRKLLEKDGHSSKK